MSERDELADDFARDIWWSGAISNYTANRISQGLRERGYRKPRTIETAKDLFHSGLTEGSIPLSVGDYYKGALWVVTGGMIARVGKERDGVCPPLLFKDPLPVTVLHEGGAS